MKFNRYLLSVISTVFLVLPLLLPGFERMGESAGRAEALPYAIFTESGTIIESFIRGLLRPFSFSNGFEASAFCGHVTLALCVLAVKTRRKPKAGAAVPRGGAFPEAFLFSLFVCALFCFLWQTNIIARFLYVIPYLNRFRWHFKLQALFFFYINVFAAAGLSLFIETAEAKIKKYAKTAVITAVSLLITAQLAEFALVYAFTYDRPLAIKTFLDTPPYEEPLAEILTDGRYISVGFDENEYQPLHTLGYAYSQLYGLYAVSGYEMFLPAANQLPALGLNYTGFIYDYRNFEHYRIWGVRYYAADNAYTALYGPPPFETDIIYRDERRVVFEDSEAAPLIYKSAVPEEELAFTAGVNKITVDADVSNPTVFTFNVLYHKNFKCYADKKEIKLHRTSDGQMSALIPGGTSRITLKYTEPAFFQGLGVTAAFAALCLLYFLFNARHRKHL